MGYETAQHAQALTVEEIRQNMTTREQSAYISGIVDAFAMERFLSEPSDEDGMNCIFSWYYMSENPMAMLNQNENFFDEHPDRQVAILLYALIRQECGE